MKISSRPTSAHRLSIGIGRPTAGGEPQPAAASGHAPSTALALISCVLGGLAAGLGLPPHGLWPLALLCLTPLLRAALGLGMGRAVVCGLFWGAAQAGVVFCWLPEVLTDHGGLDTLDANVVTALGWLYQGLFPAAFAGVVSLTRRRPALALALAPLLWAASEHLRGMVGLTLPWMGLGQALAQNPELIQSAELWGADGLSVIVATVNCLLMAAALPGQRHHSQRTMAVVLALFCLAAAWLWGNGRLAQVRARCTAAPRLEACLAQGDFSIDRLRNKTAGATVVHRLAALSRDAVRGHPRRPLLVVWPETAAPYYLFSTIADALPARYLAMELGAHLALGARGAVETPNGLAPTNRVWYLNPDGEVIGRYDKTRLAPFGEHIPVSWLKRWLRPLASGQELTPGGPSTLVTVGPAKVGALVCFEAAFDDLARARANAGANLLLNLANDAWFADREASAQALAQLRLRAVENRRSCLRAANRGQSGLIGPDGEVTATTGPSIIVAAPLLDGQTIFDRWWPWSTLALALTAALMIGFAARLRQR